MVKGIFVDPSKVEALSATLRGKDLLSVLGRQSKLYQALETDVGQEILHTALKRAEALLKKVVEEEASAQELAEYRVLKTILFEWALKIDEFYKNLNKISK